MRGVHCRRVAIIGVASLLWAASCDSDRLPITGSSATAGATENSTFALDNAAKSLDVLNNSGVMHKLEDLGFGSAVCQSSAARPSDEGIDDIGQGLKDISAWLADHVFTTEQIDSETSETVVYQLLPAVFCSDDGSVDEECATFLQDYPVRLHTTSPSEGDLDVVVEVGDPPRQLAKLRLYDNEFAASIDLDQLKRTLEAITAHEQDPPTLPQTMQGVVELALTVYGEADVGLAISLLEPVRLVLLNGQDDPVELNIARSISALSGRLSAATETASWGSAWQAVDATLPGSTFCDANPSSTDSSEPTCGDKERDGTFTGHLAGLSSEWTLDGIHDQLSFSNVGLGNESSVVKLGQDTLAKVDLNPNNDRRFAGSLERTDNGIVATVEPAIDLAVAMKLTHLSDSMKVDLPSWLADELFDVMIGGPPRAKILIPVEDPCATAGEESGPPKVMEGTVTLSASSLSEDTVIQAGQCITEVSGEDQHPFESVAAGTCN